MSHFEELLSSSVVRKKKLVEIKLQNKTLEFTANEISYAERLHLSQISVLGGEAFSQLIMYSITDPDGKRMTREQVNALPDEVAEKFFIAATEINSVEVKTEKN